MVWLHFISQPHSFHSGGRWGGSRTWGQCCGKSDLPGVRAKAVSLGKCFQESARPLFFSRRAKVLAATQRPSWGGALFYVFAKPCPSSLPPAVSSFCVSSLHLLSFNPLFCGIRTAVSGEGPQRPGPFRLLGRILYSRNLSGAGCFLPELWLISSCLDTCAHRLLSQHVPAPSSFPWPFLTLS